MGSEVDGLLAKYERRAPGKNERLGRGLPGDHAGAALFLAPPSSDCVAAPTLHVDGRNGMS